MIYATSKPHDGSKRYSIWLILSNSGFLFPQSAKWIGSEVVTLGPIAFREDPAKQRSDTAIFGASKMSGRFRVKWRSNLGFLLGD
jgi:hypothetical protein